MSDSATAGFGKFVPGFDFLQGLAKQASSGVSGALPQLPNLGNWVAPTLNVEELEKRIDELKAVQFWLDQNALALKATIQALEVQKMTLATLKGMNFNLGDVANAFKLKAADTVNEKLFGTATHSQDEEAAGNTKPSAKKSSRSTSKQSDQPPPEAASGGLVDPAAWWGALTQQFQHIAANAVKDVSKHATAGASKGMAEGLAKGAVAAATGVADAVGGAVGNALSSSRAKAVKKPVKAKPVAAKKRSMR
jgi:hypothetical protein